MIHMENQDINSNEDSIIICERPTSMDFVEIHNVLTAAHKGNRDVEFNTTDLTNEELSARLSGGGTTYVALADGRVVGTVTISIEECNKWYAGKKAAMLRYVAVMPEYSRKHIASRLISACVEWAWEHEVSTLLWTTAANNSVAIATSKKNLFQKVDYIKFKSINHPSVRLVRWLDERRPSCIVCMGFYLIRKGFIHVYLMINSIIFHLKSAYRVARND